MEIKLCFAMITFNSDFVLKECLENIYPYANQIVITHGCVKYWQDKGFTTSTDGTNHILNNFPDPEKKITVINQNANEKTELCKAYMAHVKPETTHLWCIDSDEIFKPMDILNVIEFLRNEDPAAVGFRSNTFYGGFKHIIGGFEKEHSFKRLLKYVPGCEYIEHRPPTLGVNGKEIEGKYVGGQELEERTGVTMYHYSYVFERQVREKIEYYENAVISKGNCIPNYVNEVWIPWSKAQDREGIEKKWNGVHEFMPNVRGAAKTEVFGGEHPEIIKAKFKEAN